MKMKRNNKSGGAKERSDEEKNETAKMKNSMPKILI